MLKSSRGSTEISAWLRPDRISPESRVVEETGEVGSAGPSFSEKKFLVHANPKRYYGAICAKHPEAGGERTVSSRSCCACNWERMRERRAADPDYWNRVGRVAWKKWYPKNRKRFLARQRLKKTGIDAETFEKLWSLQDGKCAVCVKPLVDGRAHADHCHDSKTPRGILCATCNQAEGLIRRSGLGAGEFGDRLASYLANPTAKKL